MDIWKTNVETKQYKNAEKENDDFFETLRLANGPVEINGITVIDRYEQNLFALSVMEAIKNKSILLLEAGVGTGKSMGYLIPIFYTYKNVNRFEKIIISTSSLALQQQLLIDINKVSQMLNVNLKCETIKGIKNYACQKKLEDIVAKSGKNENTTQEIKRILKTMTQKQSADRSDLGIISEKVWKKIKAESRGMCSKCAYAPICYYQKLLKESADANIIITNHAYLSYLANSKDELLSETDAIIIDEAHKLEENVRNVNEKEINLENIKESILEIQRELEYKCGRGLSNKMQNLFIEIRNNVRDIGRNNSRYVISKDNQEMPFNYSEKIKENLAIVIEELNKFISSAKKIIMETKPRPKQQRLIRTLKEPLETLENITRLFEDMAKGPTRDNIYWAMFPTKNKVTIHYTPKSVRKTLDPIYSRKIPIIFTSGTMIDAEGSYNYFREGIGLNERVNVSLSEPDELKSPYNFSENSLVYYNSNLPSPNFDKNLEAKFNTQEEYLNYIHALAIEVDRLIRLTEGKALILFTSKKDMEAVYSLLSTLDYPFKLLIQDKNNANSDKIKNDFAKDTNSCLFATGAFWEGIDIKGKSLSNLIICHLPFPNVGPIEEYKASIYSEENRFEKVYFNEMIKKLKQGTGRLIRGYDDTGIVCCLDPRFKTYFQKIQENLPFEEYTQDIEKLQEFVNEKILNTSPNKGSR